MIQPILGWTEKTGEKRRREKGERWTEEGGGNELVGWKLRIGPLMRAT